MGAAFKLNNEKAVGCRSCPNPGKSNDALLTVRSVTDFVAVGGPGT